MTFLGCEGGGRDIGGEPKGDDGGCGDCAVLDREPGKAYRGPVLRSSFVTEGGDVGGRGEGKDLRA